MHLDVTDLKQFYDGDPLGRMTAALLGDRLAALWPDLHGMTVVGFGYAAPFLTALQARAERTLCLMPAQQGVVAWPSQGRNLSALVEETLWPLPKGFADRILVAHGLETCERPNALLQEIHRVLAPNGRAVFVAPNRAGLWARRDATPFGFGRPYSASQLERTLTDHDFTVGRRSGALYMPPSQRRFWMRLAPTLERAGQAVDAQRLAGVTIVEVTKLVYVTPQSGLREAARVPLRVLGGLRPTPAPKPATGRSAARTQADKAD
jgi:SAM-dependent methyltransferase